MTTHFSKVLLPLAFFFGLACLGACSSDEILAKQSGPPQEPVPDYKAIIGEALSAKKMTFQISDSSKTTPTPPPAEWEIKNPELYAPFEISGARQVQSLQGWAWLVCLKGDHRGQPIYFGVFIQRDRIANIRGNVSVDLCPYQQYEPLTLRLPQTTPWPFRVIRSN